MAKRGGIYPGVDIPEFYELVEALFTPEEAAVNNAMPKGTFSAKSIAQTMGRKEEAVQDTLEDMADKGLCFSVEKDGRRLYAASRFVPGIMEFQFMRGTGTEKDKNLARLIYAYKEAIDASRGPIELKYPNTRVLTVDEKIKTGNKIHTYQQVSEYIKQYDPISVSTCFCRHEAELIDENDSCGNPNEVCMQFGDGAKFIIERKLGRKVNKAEALKILKAASEAGLVHCTDNTQKIDFLCNCCSCHCIILKTVLAQTKPGRILSSGFLPLFSKDLCIACETCVDICPVTALEAKVNEVPGIDLNRCIGCGVCAINCPEEAILMVERESGSEPPVDKRAMMKEMFAAYD